jgi:hypothetical protein
MADTSQPAKSEAPASDELEILHLSTKDEGEKVEFLTLFTIDEAEFQVPKNPSPTVGLKYLKIMKTEGPQNAAYFMLTSMLGEAGYDALMNYDKLTDDQYNFVLSAALRIATGKTERPKGTRNRRAGSSGRRN